MYFESRRIPSADDQEVWNYYPRITRDVDELARTRGLRYGLSGFWESKVITMLSREGVRVHPVLHAPGVQTRLVPMHWLSNSRWYFEGPASDRTPPRYEFIVSKPFEFCPTPSIVELTEVFGEPAHVVNSGAFKLAVYNRPTDTRFQHVAEGESNFLREKFQGKVGESIRFDASSLVSTNLGPLPPEERTAIEGCMPAGVLGGGTYLKIEEAGEYRIEIETSSTACGQPFAGTWDVILINPQNNLVHPFHEAGINPGEHVTASVVLNFGKRHRGRLMECRVIYNGTGVLQMHGLTITRVK